MEQLPRFDVESLRIQSGNATAKPAVKALPGTRPRRQRFIRAVGLEWFNSVARLPGQALQIAMLLWYRAGLTGRLEDLRLDPEDLEPLGITPRMKRHALNALAAVEPKLIRLTHVPGKESRVTLLISPSPPPALPGRP